MKHSISYCLSSQGWERDDSPASEVGECVDIVGCYRPGRWSHPHVAGNYCAQHAHAGSNRGCPLVGRKR